MARRTTATARSCLAAVAALATAVALFGINGDAVTWRAAGPDGISNADGDRSEEAVASRTARRIGKAVQVRGLTSETTEVWALPDGQFKAEIAAGVVRVRRGDGWVPVDLTLRRAADTSIAPVAHPNDLRVSGAQPAGTHELAAVGRGVDRVTMGWTGPLPEPALDGNRATYVDVSPGVDLVVAATPTGFEQSLIVKNRAAIAHVERVPLSLTGPAIAGHTKGADGGITLRNKAGQVLASVPAPVMWDARTTVAGTPARTEPIRTAVVKRAGGIDLSLTPSLAWLRNAATVFPVTLDPTVNPVSTTFDTYVRESVTTDMSGQTDLQIGLLATTPPTIARSFLTWDTAVLAGKQINSSTVSLFNFWSHICTPQSWEIWSTGAASTATRYASQPAWNYLEATSTATHGSTGCADAWATIDGKNFFQRAAAAGGSVAHMGIKATDETVAAGFKQFRSRDGAAAEVPKATVTYNSYPTVTARSTVPASVCATGTSRPAVNSLTPELRATVSDGDGTAMSVAFEWWAVGGSTPIGSATVSGVASGATASTTVPAGAFVDGGRYQWRVKASDGTAGSDTWTSFCEMTVYVTAPPVEGCAGGVDSDFNGDGVTDVAIADPEATVSGREKAGQVHITYGGTGTTHTLYESNAQVDGASEAGDQFGTALAAYDANNDGCADLAVGTPYEDLGGQADVGTVYVLLGTPAGLAKGPASLTYHQDKVGVPDSLEPEDWFGYSVAGGRTAAGEPYLLIGAPGEDLGTAVDAGLVHYLRGTVNIVLDQSIAGMGDSNETDDRFGYAVAGSPHHIVAGRPGESVGEPTFAGAATIFSHTLTSGLPTLVTNLHQNSPNISNSAEADDQFGKSVAIAPYRPAGTPIGQPDSLLVVGVPGEDLTLASGTVVPDAGLAMRFHVTTTGVTDLSGVPESAVGGAEQDGAYFGERVLVVNTAPNEVATNNTLLIAAAAPGEDVNGQVDAGLVRVFPALATPITGAVTVRRSTTALPGNPVAQELLGVSLGGTSQRLYVGSPYGDPAVYALPWTALTTGNTLPQQTWKPGTGGIPATEAAFGAAIS